MLKEESARKSSEAAVAELRVRLEEVESLAVRSGGKKAMERLENRVSALAQELDSEQVCLLTLLKNRLNSAFQGKDLPNPSLIIGWSGRTSSNGPLKSDPM